LEYWIAYNKSKAQIIVQAKADSWKEIRDQWPKWEAERGQSEAEGGQTEELYNTTGERTQPVKEESLCCELRWHRQGLHLLVSCGRTRHFKHPRPGWRNRAGNHKVHCCILRRNNNAGGSPRCRGRSA